MVLETFLPLLSDFIKDPIKQYVVLRIKRHLSYAFNYEAKVGRLQEVADKLKIKRDRLEKSVADATRNGEEIYDHVTHWLATSAKAIEEAQQVVHSKDDAVQNRCFIGLCPNFRTRYQLGKTADKKASAVDNVQDGEDLDLISYRPLPKQKVVPSVYIPEALPSRVSILQEVMDALNDPNLSMIGVHGMGGVGKTTLAKEVHRQAQADKLFDFVVMVVVSQTPDLRRIQTEIAEALGMDLKEEGMLIRANRLSDRLKKEKILIIFDDIWKQLELEELGIPMGHDSRGCKMLLTSRRLEVLCSGRGMQKNIKLDVLREKEAWSLFEMTANAVKNQNLPPIAFEVAQKCAGLPLLILKVVADLKNKGLYAWNDKLKQLSDFDDKDIQAKIHSVLADSYNNLSNDQLKSFFLLCGLFGQSNIQIKHLLMYGIGLGLFRRMATLEDARNQAFTLIDDLKAESLLLEGDMAGCVKMHDVVRDTAMSISSRVQHAFFGSSGSGLDEWPDKKCTRISLAYNDIHELSEGLECPEAELLFFITDDFSLKIPALFFERMRKLKVLDFNGIHFESLPSSLAFLTKLQTLCLHGCQLDDAGIVGELRQLHVLSFANSFITELPMQIGQLTRLKLLDLSDCPELKVIPANVLSRLSSLEGLHMRNSFVDWAVEGTSSEGNARLGELECLSGLSDLEMQILDARTIPKSLFLKLNGLQKYKIVIGDTWDWKVNNECSRMLKLRSSIHLDPGISKLLKEIEDLYVDKVRGIKNVVYDLDGDGFPHLKHLNLQDNWAIQHIVDSKKWSSNPVFPMLESMFLNNLGNLENIWRREDEDDFDGVVELTNLRFLHLKNLPQFGSFCIGKMEIEAFEEWVGGSKVGAPSSLFNSMVSLPNLEDLEIESICCGKIWQNNLSGKTSNLTSLKVDECNNLKHLFTPTIIENLSQLKRLEIKNCESLEEIVCIEESAEEAQKMSKIVFPKLNIMKLSELQKLKRFCSGRPIEFLSLVELKLWGCDALMSLVSNGEASLFDGMVGLPNLEVLYLMDLHNLKNVWEGKLAPDAFSKLKLLHVWGCPKLVTVLPWSNLSRFRRLEKLMVRGCDSVKEVFELQRLNDEGINDVVDFQLRHLEIGNLIDLKFIWKEDPQSVYTFKQLQWIRVDGCKLLKYIVPCSIAKHLLELESLKISRCGVEEIVGKGEGEAADPDFKFPQLISLELEELREVKSFFYPGKHRVELPKLKCLGCLGTRLLRCNPHQEIAANNGGWFPAEKVLRNLEELQISHKAFMRMRLLQFCVDSLPKLKLLNLHSFMDHSHSFLPSLLNKLNNLDKLAVYDANVEELFSDATSVAELENSGSFAPLKHLEIHNSEHLKHVWKQDAPNPRTSSIIYIETLEIQSCYSLISIAHPLSSFQNLTTLDVNSCWKLKSLITASTAKTMMQLAKLRVSNCDIMTEVVENAADHSLDETVFSKLRILELEGLPNLTSFCLGNHSFNFPVLEQVVIQDCHRMEFFCHGDVIAPKLKAIRLSTYSHEQFWEGDLNATIANLWTKWVDSSIFQLSEHSDRLKWNWHTQNFGRLFCNIQYLIVDGCEFLTKALSINQLQYLNNLKDLTVRNCESVQVVFDLEGTSSTHEPVGLLPCLTELQLIDLPMLEDLWNEDPKGILNLKTLKLLKIQKCSSLRHPFTCSTASCLENIEEIQLKNCQMMEALIKNDGMEEDTSSNIIFPSLKSVVFKCLPKLSSFYEGSGNVECSTLQKVSILKCTKVKSLFSTEQISKTEVDISCASLFNFKVTPNLEELSLDSKSITMILQCELPLEFFSKVKIVELRFFPSKSCFSLFAFLQRLPNLEKLLVNTSSLNELFLFNGSVEDSMTRSCGDLSDLAQSSLSFSNLTTLEVCQCNKLTSLIPLSVAKSLVQLVTLTVRSCHMLMEIVRGESDRGCILEFTSLENVRISQCPNLKLFCCGVLKTPKLDGVKTNFNMLWEGDLNATIQKMHLNMVGFETLRELELSKFPMLKAYWNGQFPIQHSYCLKKIVVDECASFSYAIPSDMLQYLNRLNVLVVKNCDSLEQVFDLEGPNADEADDVQMESLTELQLIDLPRLGHVWNNDPEGILSFKNLRLLKIQNCGSLTHIFTLSMALSLGNIQQIQVERCCLVEHIIIIGDEEKGRDKIIFPSLETVNLECLPGLSSFHSADDVLKCSSLKRINVVGCPKKSLFPSLVSMEHGSSMMVEAEEERLSNNKLISLLFDGKIAMESLEELCVEWNVVKYMWHQVFQVDFFCGLKALELKCCPGEVPVFPFGFHQKIPNLEIKLAFSDVFLREITHHELDIIEEKHSTSLPQLKILISCPVSFQNLTALEVSKCHGLKNLVTVTAARSLVQLKRLDIDNCEMMQEIVVAEADGVEDGEIGFSQLRFLRIQGLPSLTSFCSGNFSLNFPLLEEVIARECPNMKTFGKKVLSTPKLWKVQTGEEKYEWEWDGSLNDTIEALSMQLNVGSGTGCHTNGAPRLGDENNAIST